MQVFDATHFVSGKCSTQKMCEVQGKVKKKSIVFGVLCLETAAPEFRAEKVSCKRPSIISENVFLHYRR